VDDLFGSDAPPLRLETTHASPRRPRPSGVILVPVFARISGVRAAITIVLFGGGAWFYLFPGLEILAFPAAAMACQCLRRWNAVRWAAWSLTLAAFGAEALVLGTWPLRFVACLGLVAPYIFLVGSQLRGM
jgi:hypothetical protein